MAISNASNQIVEVNLIPGTVPSVLHLSQYDTGAGRPITFSVYDGSQAFAIPSGVSIAFEGTKPDGKGFSFTCSKSGSNALLTNYTNQMTALPGKIMCQLVFTDTSGGRVGSLPVLMFVSPAGINEDTVISDSDIEAIIATQNQYAVLNARINNLVGNTGNSNSEIVDARVGVDGSVYSNLGTAIRTQVGSLNEDLVNKSEGQIRGLLVENSYVNTDGTISSYNGWSRTNYIDVSQYSVLSLYTPDTIRYGVWFKEDKTSVVFPLLVPKATTSLFVPINAKYLMISALSEVAENIKIGVKKTRCCSNPVGMRAINVEYIATGYVSNSNGNILNSAIFVCTDYIDIPENMYIESDGTEEDNAYNAFYDENKIYISSFNTKEKHIKVPDNAKYMRLSTSNSNEQRVYTREPVALKICSFNVGLWTDGKASNARVDDANVKAESIKLRRFLGNENFDFLLCEEATHEFDKSYTIKAYEYCFENNLPHGWTTSDSTASGPVRQFLLAGKYELKNVTYHNYENASSRGYVTFASEIMGREITFINCHLSSGYSNDDEIRAKERAELIQVLKNCEYGVLMGDFNARSIDDFNDFSEFNIANHGYYGDFKTWPAAKESDPNWPNGCIDNIITTKSIKIISVLMGEIAMSDHKPLIAEIEIL